AGDEQHCCRGRAAASGSTCSDPRQYSPFAGADALSYGTLVGGMATIFTTANILLSANLQEYGFRELTMLDFLPTGGLIVVAGIAYMLLVGRHLLPNRESSTRELAQYTPPPDLPDTYQLDERLWEVRVLPGSPLVGSSLYKSRIGAELGITVLEIQHGQHVVATPPPQTIIGTNALLLVLGREERVRQLETTGTEVCHTSHEIHTRATEALYPSEIIVAPRSPAIGRTLSEMRFRSTTGLLAVALWRGGRSYRTDVGKFRLQEGDALLVQGSAEQVQALANEPGYIVPDVSHLHRPDLRKGLWAAGIAALVIGLSTFGVLSTALAVLLGAAVLVLVGIMRMEELYSAVEWRIVFLIAGMTPLSVAIQETGLAERVGEAFVSLIAPYGALALVAGLYLFTMLIGQALGGQVTALVVGPFAITAATQANVNPIAVAVAVAIACSASFLTPVAHPVNLLMMNPGGYVPGDFFGWGVAWRWCRLWRCWLE
ncbi:MAG: SLC13 family permease, partial [Chloroflexaceae bacterium]|nr:SLC13 family permease [Chloroflexaceae bacterium]